MSVADRKGRGPAVETGATAHAVTWRFSAGSRNLGRRRLAEGVWLSPARQRVSRGLSQTPLWPPWLCPGPGAATFVHQTSPRGGGETGAHSVTEDTTDRPAPSGVWSPGLALGFSTLRKEISKVLSGAPQESLCLHLTQEAQHSARKPVHTRSNPQSIFLSFLAVPLSQLPKDCGQKRPPRWRVSTPRPPPTCYVRGHKDYCELKAREN